MKKKKHKQISAKPAERPSGMKIGVPLAAVAITAVLLIVMALPEKCIDFAFSEYMGAWQVSAGSSIRREGGTVRLNKGEGDLYLVVPQMNIDADRYDVCVIEGNWPIAYDQGRLLFISPFNRQFDYYFRYDFDTGTAGRINRRYIDLRSHGAWQGIIKAILILPATNAEQVSLKSVKFIQANPWTRIKAWWSAFTRYQDPMLGSCFAMATPILMGRPFNPLIVPAVWVMLAIFGLVSAGIYWLQADRRITQIALIIFLAAMVLAWGLLETRNNVNYLKAIARDVSLYWGRSIQEKRGIVVGDPEFIRFMGYCDEQIPMDARIINLIPADVPGTPSMYLTGTQFGFCLRPRLESFYQFSGELPDSYYLVYKGDPKRLQGVSQEQKNIHSYLVLQPGEKIQQQIVLWNKLQDLSTLKLFGRGLHNGLTVTLLNRGRDRQVGGAVLAGVSSSEALFQLKPATTYRDSMIWLQLANTGTATLEVGTAPADSYQSGRLSRNEGLFYRGRFLREEISFRLEFLVRSPKLFRQYGRDGYIFTD